jgi:hypothetical protein
MPSSALLLLTILLLAFVCTAHTANHSAALNHESPSLILAMFPYSMRMANGNIKSRMSEYLLNYIEPELQRWHELEKKRRKEQDERERAEMEVYNKYLANRYRQSTSVLRDFFAMRYK